MRRLSAAAASLALFAAGCGGSSPALQGQTPQTKTLVIAVSAPLTRDAYLGTTIANGTRLGAQNLVLPVGRDFYRLKIVVYDNAGSPSQAVANVRRAIAAGAVAIVSDGAGLDASWRIANRAHVPIAIVYDGGAGLVDPRARPNVFRIAPTNHGIAFRFAEYLVPKKLKLVFLTDDTGYGREGRASLDRAFTENAGSVVARIQIPSTSTDLAPQILQARRAGATALLVWAEPAGVAEAVIAARSSGWKVPVYAPPSGEDPLVRQELAAHPDWIDGLTFAAGRMTAEQGPVPFLRFQQAYQDAFGAQEVGVKAADGRPIVQPPDYAMYPYDFVRVLGAAVRAAQSVDRETVLNALNEVSVEGANGDQRGFNQENHEGVVDDDVYFARFSGMVFVPVKDDALSSTLPPIDQEG
jgi:ABC-type branched-subunit amino acid transport system substrate-binding protein